jgi:hypothetical protein
MTELKAWSPAMIFPKHDSSVDPRLVFVAMPFATTFNALYESIENLVKDHCHLRCWRADSDSAGSRVMSDVWRATNDAIVMIADLTGNNANVFYEVGLAHAIGKHVILLTSDTSDIPFDVRDIRAIRYDSGQGFRTLRNQVLTALRHSVATLPERWGVAPRSLGALSPVRITHVQHPSTVAAGQPFEIIVRARNAGQVAREGYFSVSFPEAVYDIEIVQTDIAQQIGLAKNPWCNDTVILAYPIAEAFANPWEPSHEHFVRVRARTQRAGWLPFYVNAASREGIGPFDFDPVQGVPHTDQRGESVYCGILDIVT